MKTFRVFNKGDPFGITWYEKFRVQIYEWVLNIGTKRYIYSVNFTNFYAFTAIIIRKCVLKILKNSP